MTMEQGTSPPDPLADFIASLADRYEVVRPVGRGGMSTVYLARDLKHDREVAIKVLRSELAQSIGPERFLREITIAARLQHPHILPLLDSGSAAGQLYYVMPFVRGESLRDRLAREGRLPVGAAVSVLLDVADALRYAHEEGVVHRDIKPENVMLSGRHAVVMDFGVARALSDGRMSDDHTRTTAGIALGTPAYMAPEQAAADPSVDHRADLYAVGVLGYELLTGQPPFAGRTPAQTLVAHINEPPPPLREKRPEVPEPVVQILMQSLAKRPADRPPHAGAMLEALEPYAGGSGGMTPVMLRAVPPARRRLGLAVGGLAVLLMVIALLWSGDAGAAFSAGAARQLTTDPGLEVDPALSPDGRLLAFSAGINGRLRIHVRQTDGGNPVVVAADVDANQRWPRWIPESNLLAFLAGGSIYQVPALGGGARVIVEGSAADPVGDFALSPDGSRLAFVRGGAIHLRDREGTGAGRLLVRGADLHSLAWSPDGRRLAYVAGNSAFVFSASEIGNVAPAVIHLVATDSGATPVPVTPEGALSVSPTWHPDGRSLLYVSNRDGIRDIWLQPLRRNGRPAGDPVRLTTGLGAHGVSVRADGTEVTYSVLRQTANIWRMDLPIGASSADIRSAEPVTRGSQLVEDLDVLPTGRWLLFDANRSGNQDIFVMALPNGQPTQLTEDPADDFGPAWSPDGREVAFYSLRNGTRDLYLMSSDGRGVRQLTRDSLEDAQPRWAPDGRALVFRRRDAENRDWVWVLRRLTDTTWAEPERLVAEPGTSPDYSPDGAHVAFIGGEAVRLVSSTGGPPRTLLTPEQVEGGGVLQRPVWLSADTLLVRQELPGGAGGLWMVPLAGGRPTLAIRFDDPDRPVFRNDYVTDGDRVYFPITQVESDLWAMALTPRR